MTNQQTKTAPDGIPSNEQMKQATQAGIAIGMAAPENHWGSLGEAEKAGYVHGDILCEFFMIGFSYGLERNPAIVD